MVMPLRRRMASRAPSRPMTKRFESKQAKRSQQIKRTKPNPPISLPSGLPKVIQEVLPPSIAEPDEEFVGLLQDEAELLDTDDDDIDFDDGEEDEFF